MRRAPAVLLISGLLGFRVGMAGFPDWQVAVETSQVVAGLVKYPEGNPFFIYHTKLWTILHQLLAPLLLIGISEIRLSLLVSGLLGLVTFQALSMFIYALSGDALMAVGGAVLIFLTRAAEYGAVYALFLLGNENTYGILGLSFCVLAVAMLGCGWYRTGGFLVGLAPAVHPSLGAWTCAIAFIAMAWHLSHRSDQRQPFIRALIWLAGGICVTAVSLLVQLTLIYHAPPAAAVFSKREIAAFVTFWDGHRRPVAIAHTGVTLNIAALGLAALWLTAFAADLAAPAIFLLRVTVVAAVSSTILILISWLPPESIPTPLLIAMPGRVLNYNALTYAALILGLAARYRDRLWSRLLTSSLIIGLLVSRQSMLWEWLQLHGYSYESPMSTRWMLAIATVALVAGAARTKWAASPDLRRSAALQPLLAFSLAVFIATAVMASTFSRPRSLIFRDRSNDVFFGEVAAGKGMLLTAGDLHLIQLRTRRPVLLDGGGLDGVLYSLEAGPEMERILREVYGIDLLNPPEEARGNGRIPPEANRQAWQQYTPEKWHDIKRTFGVTQVLTYPDWLLNLPVAAHSRRFVLYQIP